MELSYKIQFWPYFFISILRSSQHRQIQKERLIDVPWSAGVDEFSRALIGADFA